MVGYTRVGDLPNSAVAQIPSNHWAFVALGYVPPLPPHSQFLRLFLTRFFISCFFIKVMERAVKDYCDKPDRLELHNPSAWFTHHAHELCFRSDPEDLEAGARDWLNDEKIKAGGRSRDKERAAKKARGERVNGPAGGRGGGGSGRGSTGWVSRGGGSRIMGRGRGGSGRGDGGRGERGDGGDAGGTGGGGGADGGSGRGGVGVGVTKKEGEGAARIRPPGDPASGRGRGQGGGVEGAESERYSQRDTSDLMSIFPSLRGRGGGRAAGVGGRGGGGRGFRQGGIRV